MLQSLRKKSTSFVAKGLFLMLVLSFAVWGIGDIFSGSGSSNSVAEVGGQEIAPQELARAFQSEIQRTQRMFGQTITQEQARQFGLLDQALQRLVAEALLDIKVDDMGISVSEDLLRRTIRADPSFQNEAGQFDENRLRSVLFDNNLTEQGFVALLHDDLARRQLVSSVTMLDHLPRTLVDRIFAYRNQRRVAETIVVPAALQDVTPPTESEMRAFYEENQDAFMAPEYRAITAISLTPATLADEIAVPEEDIVAAYNARRGQYETPEKRTIQQIVVRDEDAARRARALIDEGKTFAEASQEVAGIPPIELGSVTRGELGIETLGEAAFSAAAGTVVGPVQTPLGWHVMNVETVSEGNIQPLEAVRDEIRLSLAEDLAIDELVDLANRLEDELGGGATLEEAADTLGLDPIEINAVDDTGNTPSGQRAEGLPDDPEFLQVAFESEPGVDSFLTETRDGYFILRVDDVTEEAPLPFDDVRDDVETAMLETRREAAAEARARELLASVEAGRDMAEVADEAGLPLYKSKPVTREEDDPSVGVSDSVTTLLFDLAHGESDVAPSPDGFTVFRVSDIQTADPANRQEQVSQLEQRLVNSVKSDLLEQFDRAVRARHDVSINQRVIDAQF